MIENASKQCAEHHYVAFHNQKQSRGLKIQLVTLISNLCWFWPPSIGTCWMSINWEFPGLLSEKEKSVKCCSSPKLKTSQSMCAEWALWKTIGWFPAVLTDPGGIRLECNPGFDHIQGILCGTRETCFFSFLSIYSYQVSDSGDL